jgi:transcriptional regulator with XRE-family HTH domain
MAYFMGDFMEPDDVAKRLEKARIARGLSLSELARRADVSQSTLSSVKTGHRQGSNLTLGTARKLAKVLGISVDWLCGLWAEDQEMRGPPSLLNGLPLSRPGVAISVR